MAGLWKVQEVPQGEQQVKAAEVPTVGPVTQFWIGVWNWCRAQGYQWQRNDSRFGGCFQDPATGKVYQPVTG